MDSENPTQNRPRSPKHAPDPADSYERAKKHKADTGDLPEPEDPDDMNVGQNNAQPPDRQLNAQDEPTGESAAAQPLNQIDLTKEK